MSKIVYLLGAGASYGTRKYDINGHPVNGHIARGLPIVSELSDAIGFYLVYGPSQLALSTEPKYKKLYEELTWLQTKCEEYPTIDTYAKRLTLTCRLEEMGRLKNAIASFFTLIQSKQTRDLRYDSFIASLIQPNGKLPEDISVLSWNYDCQMEYVLNDYAIDQMPITTLWTHHNIGGAGIRLPQKTNGSVFYKLNGSALFSDIHQKGYFLDIDYYNDETINNLLEQNEITKWTNNIHFAWEPDNAGTQIIENIVRDAEVLVVIGYSFPYVNRHVDKVIINKMENLKHIYVQDIAAHDIKQNIESLLDDVCLQLLQCGKLKIDTKTSVTQFIIPNEL